MSRKNIIFISGVVIISCVFYSFSQYVQSDREDNKYVFLDKVNECSKQKRCKKDLSGNELKSFMQLLNKNYLQLTKQDKINFNLLLSEDYKKINSIFSDIQNVLNVSNYPVVIVYLSRYINKNYFPILYRKNGVNLYKEAAHNISFLFLQKQLQEFIDAGKKIDKNDIDLDALQAYYYLIMARNTKSILDKVKYVNQSVSLIEVSYQKGQDYYYNRLYRLIIYSKLPSSFSNKDYIEEDTQLFENKFKHNGYLYIYPNRKKMITAEDMKVIEKVTQ